MFIPPWREALARLSAVPETKIPRITAGLDACCCSARAQSFPSPGWLWHLAGVRRLPGGQRASALAPLLISTSTIPDLPVAVQISQPIHDRPGRVHRAKGRLTAVVPTDSMPPCQAGGPETGRDAAA